VKTACRWPPVPQRKLWTIYLKRKFKFYIPCTIMSTCIRCSYARERQSSAVPNEQILQGVQFATRDDLARGLIIPAWGWVVMLGPRGPCGIPHSGG
jgi:hypothetical protein